MFKLAWPMMMPNLAEERGGGKRERRWGRREVPLRNGVEKGRQTAIDGIFNVGVGPSGGEYLG